MNFLSAITGSGIVDSAGKVLDELFTSNEEETQGKIALKKLDLEFAKLEDASNARQAKITETEARHSSIFVAGARPFILWICGIALFWHFMLHDILAWITKISGSDITPPILAGTESLISLVVSLLGLGGMRALEKWKGVARSNMSHP